MSSKTPWVDVLAERPETRFAYEGRDTATPVLARPFRISWVVSSAYGPCGWVYQTVFVATEAEAVAIAQRPMNARQVSVDELTGAGAQVRSRRVFGRKNNAKRRARA